MLSIVLISSVLLVTTALSAPLNVLSQHTRGNVKSSNDPTSLKSKLNSASHLNSKTDIGKVQQGKDVTKTKPVSILVKDNNVDIKITDTALKKKVKYDPKLHGPTKAFRMLSWQGTPFKNSNGTFDHGKYKIGMESLRVKHIDMLRRQIAHSSKKSSPDDSAAPVFNLDSDIPYETELTATVNLGIPAKAMHFTFDLNSPLTLVWGSTMSENAQYIIKPFRDTVLLDWEIGGIADMVPIVGEVVYDSASFGSPVPIGKGVRTLIGCYLLVLKMTAQSASTRSFASLGLAPTAGNDHHPAMFIEKFFTNVVPASTIFYSIYVTSNERASAIAQYSAEIMIGGRDSTKHVGKMANFQVTQSLNKLTNSILWTLKGSNVVVNGDDTLHTMERVTFDINHDMINLHALIVAEAYKLIFDSVPPSDEEPFYTFPCKTKSKVGFKFFGSSQVFYLNSNDFNYAPGKQPGYCIGAIQINNAQAPTSTFGLPWFNSYYSSYQQHKSGNAAFIGIGLAVRA